jgi:hypothetical protein
MTILLPGLIAVSSVVVGLLQWSSTLRQLAEARRLETGIIVLLAALVVGEMLEDFGSHIETIFDSRKKRQDPLFEKEWYEYLSLAFPRDPIGRGYIRSLVLRLKFELGLALGICGLGFGVFTTEMPTCWKITTALLSFGLVIWMLVEAHDTHDTLAKLRHELLPIWRRSLMQPDAGTTV